MGYWLMSGFFGFFVILLCRLFVKFKVLLIFVGFFFLILVVVICNFDVWILRDDKIDNNMVVIGFLVFCIDCGNLLFVSKGIERNVLSCECCGVENKG